MYRVTMAIAVVLDLSLALAACHPPDKEIYEEQKGCIGVFDVALAQIPATGFRQAGLDRFEVNKAAEGDYEDALRFGANAGLDRKVILKELGDAKAQAWKAYPTAAGTASARASAKLLEAVRKCMPQPPPPNQ